MKKKRRKHYYCLYLFQDLSSPPPLSQPLLYSSFPLSRVNQNHLWVLLVCWDPEIQKKDKRRYIKCHKVIHETKAVYVRFPSLAASTGESGR